MKRLFVVFMSLMFIMCLAGCNESKEKVNIDFIIDGESHLVQIDKGSAISKDIIPLDNKNKVIELYYDEYYKQTYNNESINEDKTMYVKIVIDNLDEYLERDENDDLIIKQGYCNYMNKFLNSSYIPDDFNIKYYLGKLTESKYVVVIKDDIRMHTMQSPNMFDYGYFVGLINFRWLPEIISIIYDGEYYDICEAYKLNIISQDDVKVISHIYDYVIGTK